APVLSPDGSRLFVARHALGARGAGAWFGTGTVDVLLTATNSPLAPAPNGDEPQAHSEAMEGSLRIESPVQPPSELVQPRAVVYRKKTRSLLVASERNDTLLELDALAIDPSVAVLDLFKVGTHFGDVEVAQTGGAPSAIALSEDETIAYVLCR